MSEKELVHFVVGQPYPITEHAQADPSQEGAQAELFREEGSFIRVSLPNLKPSELRQFEDGRIKFGVRYEAPLVMLYVDFGAGLRFECPYNSVLVEGKDFAIPEIVDEDSRLVVSLHLVDPADNNTLRAIRFVTMHPVTTRQLVEAVTKQSGMKYSQYQYMLKLQGVMAEGTVSDAMKKADMRKAGE